MVAFAGDPHRGILRSRRSGELRHAGLAARALRPGVARPGRRLRLADLRAGSGRGHARAAARWRGWHLAPHECRSDQLVGPRVRGGDSRRGAARSRQTGVRRAVAGARTTAALQRPWQCEGRAHADARGRARSLRRRSRSGGVRDAGPRRAFLTLAVLTFALTPPWGNRPENTCENTCAARPLDALLHDWE